MFSLINRGMYSQAVEDEFEYLHSRLRGLLGDLVTDDGRLSPGTFQADFVRMKRNASLTVATGVFTRVNYDTPIYNPRGLYNGALHQFRPDAPGQWLCMASGQYASAQSRTFFEIWKNGSQGETSGGDVVEIARGQTSRFPQQSASSHSSVVIGSKSTHATIAAITGR